MKLTAKSLSSACSLPLAAALLIGIPACGDEPEDDGTAPAAITGGNRVTRAFEDANPYVRSSVILSMTRAGTRTQCSGTKIGDTRYLTAGHCTVAFPPGNAITISNARDTTLNTTVTKSFVHPSWRKVASAASSYDIGILDVSGTSSIPTWNSFGYSFVPDTQDSSVPYRYVGWGFSNAACNTGSGLPRYGDVQSWSRSASPAGRFWDGDYSHNVMEYKGPSGCFGDSGGPLFEIATGNIVGVENATAPTTPTNGQATIFTRIDKLESFIEDPLAGCRSGCDAECLDKITSEDSAAFYPQCFDQCVASNC